MIYIRFAIERNSNSWHVLVTKEHSRLVEDNEHTDYIEVYEEFDVALGNLEPVIDRLGIDNLTSMESILIDLELFPKPVN